MRDTDLVREQIAWWRAEGWTPARALVALGLPARNARGGTWQDVRVVAAGCLGELAAAPGPLLRPDSENRARRRAALAERVLAERMMARRADRLERELLRGDAILGEWAALEAARI